MSVRIMSLVFENQKLSSTEKLIMLALADHANDEGKSVYPSQSTVARKTSLTRPTVNRIIQELIDANYLERIGYREDRSGTLEVSIIVENLIDMGVTEDDRGVFNDDMGVSLTMTPPVFNDDTNHHLTIINNHQLTKKGQSDLFNDCKRIYETKKGRLVTDGQAFVLMINNFKRAGVTADDYAAAIDAMDADPRYKASKPTSYEKWAIGYAEKRKQPKKDNSKRNEIDMEKLMKEVWDD